MTLGEGLGRPANAFGAVRLALALAVVVSHAFSVTTGRVEDEPLLRLTGFTLGEHAVNGFFAVSGFLVTMSYEGRGPRDYLIARTLRIVPGLVGATLAVSLLLGAALTSLPVGSYLGDPALWRFVSGTLTTFKSNAALPGVFTDNPFRFPMGTVWTLKYEVLCYGGVLAAGLLRLLRRPWPVLALACGLFAAIMALDIWVPGAGKGQQTALRLPFLFVAGAALYLWRDRVRISSWSALASILAVVALARTPAYPALLFAAEAYAVVAVSLSPVLARPWLDLRHDLSYGVYLYGWPVQQGLRQAAPGADAWTLLGPALALTLAVAAVSWFAVERPALSLKARALRPRSLGSIGPAAP